MGLSFFIGAVVFLLSQIVHDITDGFLNIIDPLS